MLRLPQSPRQLLLRHLRLRCFAFEFVQTNMSSRLDPHIETNTRKRFTEPSVSTKQTKSSPKRQQRTNPALVLCSKNQSSGIFNSGCSATCATKAPCRHVLAIECENGNLKNQGKQLFAFGDTTCRFGKKMLWKFLQRNI